ncbi:hypothetical protein Tco_0660872 [Tanacetum coccineum]
MASQDARLSKFEANFKQQQSEITNKINTVLKAIVDRIAGALPSDTQQSDSHNDEPEEIKEEEQEREGDPEDTNTIAYNEEQRDTLQLEREDITAFDNLGLNRDDDGIECAVEDALDLLNNEDDYDRGCRKPSDLEDGFYRYTIKLGPEYLIGMDDEGEVTYGLVTCERLAQDS